MVEVADAAPNEKEAAAGGGAVEPKDGAAVTDVGAPKDGTAEAVVFAEEPKVNNPVAAAVAVVVAGAVVVDDPKAKGLTVATEDAVVLAPNDGAVAAADVADTFPNEKSPDEGAAEDNSVFVVAAAVAPKVKGFASAVVLDPKEETEETVVDAWPKEKDDAEEVTATVVEACVEAPKLKLGVAGCVFGVSVFLDAPKENTAGAVVVIATLAAAELIAGTEVTEGPPRLAAPNVKGTAAFSAVSALVTAGFEPKLKTVEGAAELVVEGAGAADAGTVTLESTSVFFARLNVGTGSPVGGLDTSVDWL